MTTTYQSVTRRKGGLKSIALINVDQIIDYEYDKSVFSFTNLTLQSGAEFCNICYIESTAYYLETTVIDKGSPRVTHDLLFSLSEADTQTDEFLTSLAEGAISGVAALITDNNSKSFLVGFTPNFLGERALKLSKLYSDSALQLSAKPLSVITLSSEDTVRAIGVS